VIWRVEEPHCDQFRTSRCYLRRPSSHDLGDVCGLLGIGSEPCHGSQIRSLEFGSTVQSDAEERGIEFGLIDRHRALNVNTFDSVALGQSPYRISQLLQEIRIPASDVHGEIQCFI